MNLSAKLLLAICASAALCSSIGLAIHWQTTQAMQGLGASAPEALQVVDRLGIGLAIVPFALALGATLVRGRRRHRADDRADETVGAPDGPGLPDGVVLADDCVEADDSAGADATSEAFAGVDPADGFFSHNPAESDYGPVEPCSPVDSSVEAGATAAFPLLLASVDADTNLYASIADDARDNIADENAALKYALQSDVLADASRHAHTLKTLAALLGATRLHDLAAQVQHAADDGALVRAVQAYLPMHAEAKATLAHLDAERRARVPALAALAS